jgi:hypothetical protein
MLFGSFYLKKKTTTATHSFMDEEMSAGDRRKHFHKSMKSGKGHSLDDSSMASHSTGGLKAAASESQLNESNDSFLAPPKKGKQTSSKLSLFADKVGPHFFPFYLMETITIRKCFYTVQLSVKVFTDK